MEERLVGENEMVPHHCREAGEVMCELFYTTVEAAVVTGHGVMQWFEEEGGLRQGSVLSPLLYIIIPFLCWTL